MKNLLLVPGLNCTEALFAPQIANLSDVCVSHVADHASHASLEAIASAILLTAPERFALAGLSMGGYVAFEILRQAPERVERLCLLDTRAENDTPEDLDRRRQTIALAEQGKFLKLQDILWPRLVHPSRLTDTALEAIVIGMMRETGPQRFIRQQTAVMNRRDYTDVLARVAVPTTIIVGAQDVITPPEAAKRMATIIPGSHYVEIADCGHLSSLEQPEAVTRHMRQWLTA